MSQRLCRMCVLLLFIYSSGVAALDGPPGSPPESDVLSAADILPVDEAFRLGGYFSASGSVVFWQVLPGYYLYRDKILFTLDGENLEVRLPRGKLRQDEVFGEVEVVEGLVEVHLPVQSERLEIKYQGCAEQGYCYPPQSRSLNFAENRLNDGDFLENRQVPF